jgi:hypothetical protein
LVLPQHACGGCGSGARVFGAARAVKARWKGAHRRLRYLSWSEGGAARTDASGAEARARGRWSSGGKAARRKKEGKGRCGVEAAVAEKARSRAVRACDGAASWAGPFCGLGRAGQDSVREAGGVKRANVGCEGCAGGERKDGTGRAASARPG